jgi:hypothetical protein
LKYKPWLPKKGKMTNLSIPDDLAERLQQLAQQEKRPIEDVLTSMVEVYTHQLSALIAMDGMFDDPITDLSTSIRETMGNFYKGKHDHSG